MAKRSVEPREFLVDVSRLIWRYWTRRLPTGIDRVCLAYLEHFGDRAQAVVQRGGQHLILSPRQSDRLFRLLLTRQPATRFGLAKLLTMSAMSLRSTPDHPGLIYINVGHTGLNEVTLPRWIRHNQLRAIYLVHDLIPLTHPHFCRAGEAAKHARRMDNVFASATGIIGNSQATIDELKTYARARGRALPPTVAAWISGPPLNERLGRPPLTTPYFVILGTIEGRKNHQLVLDVWAKMVAERGSDAPTLVIIGQRGWQADAAFARLDRPGDFSGRLLQFDRCEDEELAAWLGGARALLMPSFVEGFGLPVLEALQSGTPVISSDLPVFREIADGIATFLDPMDAPAWKSAIESFIDDGPERTRQLVAMQTYAAPTWPKHFAIVDAWMETLGAGRR